MDDLKFNIYALSNPKTPAEYSALLDEALLLLEELNTQWAEIFNS